MSILGLEPEVLGSTGHVATEFEIKRLQDQCATYREKIARLEIDYNVMKDSRDYWRRQYEIKGLL